MHDYTEHCEDCDACVNYNDQRPEPGLVPDNIIVEAKTILPENTLLSTNPQILDDGTFFLFETVDIGDFSFELVDFVVVPVDPEPNELYTVAVLFVCMDPATDFLQMSIVGTDGYVRCTLFPLLASNTLVFVTILLTLSFSCGILVSG